MSELEASLGPCPWCGGRLWIIDSYGRFSVDCNAEGCTATGPLRSSPQEAAAAWLDRFPRLGLPVDPPEGFVRVRVVVWTDYADAIDVAFERAAAPADGTARASVVVADVPLQTVFPVVGVTL